jgi:hypothetical protein
MIKDDFKHHDRLLLRPRLIGIWPARPDALLMIGRNAVTLREKAGSTAPREGARPEWGW